MDLSMVAQLPPDQLRVLLPSFLAGFFADDAVSVHNRERVSQVVQTWSDDACNQLRDALVEAGSEFTTYTAAPAGRSLSRTWSHDAIVQHSCEGAQHLREAMQAGPTIVLCNHFSYYDATATDAIVAWSGHEDLADRLFFAAGPKVYQHLFRKVAATCLNTVKVPQSTKLSHTDRLSSRELARRAISSMKATKAALSDGRALLLYPEGSRTRDGRLQPFLKGVHRYLGLVEPLSVVPMTIVGTQHLMGVGDDERITPSPVHIRFLPALDVGQCGGGREALVEVRHRIGSALPPEHRPDPETPDLA